MIAIITLISFAFGLGVVVGKSFFQLPKAQESTEFILERMKELAREATDSYTDFQRDFIDFTDRN